MLLCCFAVWVLSSGEKKVNAKEQQAALSKKVKAKQEAIEKKDEERQAAFPELLNDGDKGTKNKNKKKKGKKNKSLRGRR